MKAPAHCERVAQVGLRDGVDAEIADVDRLRERRVGGVNGRGPAVVRDGVVLGHDRAERGAGLVLAIYCKEEACRMIGARYDGLSSSARLGMRRWSGLRAITGPG